MNMDCAGTGKDGGNMKIRWEDRLLYALLALFVLAAFYGIYFAKVLAQKRRGRRAAGAAVRFTHGIYRTAPKGNNTEKGSFEIE